jgi:DNA-binding winged helix-turn-helix (wHTH) protein
MPPEIFRFGEFELAPSDYTLRRCGERVTLRPQAFRVLVLLVERAGALVSREEIRQGIWPGEIVVDFEHGLNSCIRQVRAALGDQADHPRFIETVPRVGYRFIAAVEQEAWSRSAGDAASHERVASSATVDSLARPSTRAVMGGLGSRRHPVARHCRAGAPLRFRSLQRSSAE